jgi:hypothetical protein
MEKSAAHLVLSAQQSTVTGTRACSLTYAKQQAWSTLTCTGWTEDTQNDVFSHPWEKICTNHHKMWVLWYSNTTDASPIMQGTMMIHHQLQSCNLAACSFTSFCSSTIRWMVGTPWMSRQCKATSQCMKLLTVSALKFQITVLQVAHMCNWRKTVSLRLLYLQVFHSAAGL